MAIGVTCPACQRPARAGRICRARGNALSAAHRLRIPDLATPLTHDQPGPGISVGTAGDAPATPVADTSPVVAVDISTPPRKPAKRRAPLKMPRWGWFAAGGLAVAGMVSAAFFAGWLLVSTKSRTSGPRPRRADAAEAQSCPVQSSGESAG